MNPLICGRCGALAEAPLVESPPAVLVCQACEHRQPFRRLPLWCVTGPSGTGKSTVSRILVERLQERFVALEQDVLWLPIPAQATATRSGLPVSTAAYTAAST